MAARQAPEHRPDGVRSRLRKIEPPASAPKAHPVPLGAPFRGRTGSVLALQRLAGNRATQQLLRPPPATLVVQRKWNVDEWATKNVDAKAKLLVRIGKVQGNANSAKRANARLRTFAEETDSPEQLGRLLTLAKEDWGSLVALLKLASAAQLEKYLATMTPAALQGVLEKLPTPESPIAEEGAQAAPPGKAADRLADHYKAITEDEGKLLPLIGLESDVAVLGRLKAIIPDITLLTNVLKGTPAGGAGRGDFLEKTITKAGGWANLGILNAYSGDVGVLSQLIDKAGAEPLKALALKKHGPVSIVKGKGPGILKLLDYGPFATVADLVERNPTADISHANFRKFTTEAKLATGATGAKVDPFAIRFTQETVTNQGQGYKVSENVSKLKATPTWDIPGDPIRVFTKIPAMNSIPDKHTQFGDASPHNLENGKTYTLDNRRLYAYQQAGRSTMPLPEFAPADAIRRESYKFTTVNFGVSASLV